MRDAAANRRIAKNTVMLYLRTAVTLFVGLYTGRVMLAALGVENYGITNVVGGIVGMSSLITGAVSSTIARFITYALGEGDRQRMRLVFSTSVNVQLLLSVVSAVALEIVGIWFLDTKAVIPAARMAAAHWVLQCSILSLVFGLIASPYNATIVAHEHLSIYAYMSIVDVMLKLGVCFAISAYGGDRLILLSVLNAGVGLAMRLFYGWYCARHFEEARYDLRLFDRRFVKEMSQFVGWHLCGQAVWIYNTQGLNMLMNVFFGVVFNAARGVAATVTGAVTSFVTNFTVAFVPQITKSYAAGDRERLMTLLFQGTKFVWYLFVLFIIPIFLEAETLLTLWLGTPPDHAVVFLRFALVESWSVSISFALHNAILATGKIKRVYMEIAAYTSLIFPLTWLCFKSGFPAWSAYLVFILFNTTAKGFSIAALRRSVELPAWDFMKEVVFRCTAVTAVAFALPALVAARMSPSLSRFVVIVPLSVLWTALCVCILGMDRHERSLVLVCVNRIIGKIKRGGT